MKIGNIPLITGLVCSSIIFNMFNLSFAIDNLQTGKPNEQYTRTGTNLELGYKPVRDECPNLEDVEALQDNSLYKEWCEETFNNGIQIYEGYKDIAFNIKYESEAAKSDFWQTPSETTNLQKGDCEDAVFLFFSHLPPNQENAEIVWGWVIDNQTGIARAHVWYQLTDKDGRQYVVEGFSNDWNGIIPMEIIERTETRKSILTITNLEASRLASLINRPDSLKTFQMLADLHGSTDFVNNETNNNSSKDTYARYRLDSKHTGNSGMSREFKMSWKLPVKQRFNMAMSKEISKIFKKLHELFTRYDKQMEDFNTNSYVTNRNINPQPGRKLICRR
ncbi:MAG: hypothetical protein ACYSTS_12025 [Planctomycetota bacterium]